MDEEKLGQILEQLNATQGDFTRRIAATELLLIGVLRALKHNPDATLEVERTIAEFAKGSAPAEARAAITQLAQSIAQAAYE